MLGVSVQSIGSSYLDTTRIETNSFSMTLLERVRWIGVVCLISSAYCFTMIRKIGFQRLARILSQEWTKWKLIQLVSMSANLARNVTRFLYSVPAHASLKWRRKLSI
jgi:hypothetical protein